MSFSLDTRPGTFGYAAGTVAGTVNVPAGKQLGTVLVHASSSAPATLTLGGGATITIPAGAVFSERVEGGPFGPAVVIGGSPAAYYISWS